MNRMVSVNILFIGCNTISVNLTARRAREPAWAGGIMWPTAQAMGKEGAAMTS
jgi:hypothetical protein